MKTTPTPSTRLLPLIGALATAYGLSAALPAHASSHREAPSITATPKVDATDFYMFNSYETGRENYVSVMANYLPLQDPYGGPNYFSLDPNALYEIHIDNNGDGKEDITFQFRFKNTLKGTTGSPGIQIPIGSANVAIPLIQAGGVTVPNSPNLNLNETFTVDIVRGDRRKGTKAAITNANGGSATFAKPVDNIGSKTIPDYNAYAAQHIYSVNIPGCSAPGKVFVGQRKDPFAVNLGVIFDLVNVPLAVITDPALKDAARDPANNAGADRLEDKNVTTLAIEVPKSCLTAGTDPVIGGWTTASVRQGSLINPTPRRGHGTTAVTGGAWTQVSRLGSPLVNEVVIGLPDKDRFNGSKPKDDLQFATYVTNPTLPSLLEIAFATGPGVIAPTNLPRTDLLNVFLNGITGVNRPTTSLTSAGLVPAEMLRLNTAIPAVPLNQQNRLGVGGEVVRVGGAAFLGNAVDLAGYPNGRRPSDDVVDISLIAVAGALCLANSVGDLSAINGTNNANVLGLNTFTIPGATPTVLSSTCNAAAVPLGATALKLHDGIDQAVDTPGYARTSTFPYFAKPIPGAGSN
ncbi:MAG: DUF4331 domain-containing protein [Burkholderiaceae bacterium]|nr:DUF4331 domain-containing protein [Burkholderiaceae bacterium]